MLAGNAESSPGIGLFQLSLKFRGVLFNESERDRILCAYIYMYRAVHQKPETFECKWLIIKGLGHGLRFGIVSLSSYIIYNPPPLYF